MLPVLLRATEAPAALLPAGEQGRPLIQYFGPKDYHALPYCGAMAQDRAGLLYVGNRDCVLCFDGHAWTSIPTGGQVINALELDGTDRIWIGGNSELGYLESDGRGGRTFHSLKDQLPEAERNFGRIYHVYALSHGIYFVGADRILRWHEDKWTVEKFGHTLLSSRLGDEFYIHFQGDTLRAFDGKTWRVVADQPELRQVRNVVVGIAPHPDGGLLLCTLEGGLFRLNQGKLEHRLTDADAMIKAPGRVLSVFRLSDGTLALNTFTGTALLSPTGGVLCALEQESGSLSSTVNSAYQDRRGHLWLSLQNGLTRFDWPVTQTVLPAVNGVTGETITALLRHRGRLYAGTNKGLRVLESAQPGGGRFSPAHLVPVPGFAARISKLLSAGDDLIVLAGGGLWVLGHDSAGLVAIPSALGTYHTCGLLPAARPDLLYVAAGTNLIQFLKTSGEWRRTESVAGIQDFLANLIEAKDGSVWGITSSHGLYRFVGLPGSAAAPVRVERYTEWIGAGGGKIDREPWVEEQDGRVLFMDVHQARWFDPASHQFVVDTAATAELTQLQSGGDINPNIFPSLRPGARWRVPFTDDPTLQPFGGRRIWRNDRTGHRDYLAYRAVNTLEPSLEVREEAAGADGSILWLYGGAALLRAELPGALARPRDFQTILRRIEDDRQAPQPLQATTTLRFPSGTALHFTAATDLLESGLVAYRTRLDGRPWSGWSEEHLFHLERLGPGTHTFAIQAMDADGNTASPAGYSFIILPPWWQSWWALGLYGFTGLGAILGYARWRTLRLERQTKELEQLVSERTGQLSRAKAEAEAANVVKSEFIASMNHEIRNPMNGILGLTKMLEASRLEPRDRAILQTLGACTEQLRSTMDDVLDFRSLEKGGVTLAEENFELVGLLRGACAAADLEGNRIRLLNPPDAPVWLQGDQGKFRQILGNYFSNALKYGLPPGAEAEVDMAMEEAGRTAVTVRVRNQGPTLSEEEQTKLFTLFYRGSRARASQASGTGLGLALCRRLAEAMGGKTGVSSEGNLTTFWVRLPFAQGHGSPASASDSLPLPLQFHGRVLAVEDEIYNRMVLGHFLEAMGFAVDWATSGETALEYAREQAYRLIITDWYLPDQDGGSLIRRLRQDLGSKLPPVLVISAYATTEKKDEALAAGADAFLTKPVDERKLRLALASLGLGPVPGSVPDGVPAGPGGYDFRPLIGLGQKEEILSRYLEQVEANWTVVEKTWPTDHSAATRRVHELRSQVLLVHARLAADQLRLLEQGLAGSIPEADLATLVQCAGREIKALLEALAAEF